MSATCECCGGPVRVTRPLPEGDGYLIHGACLELRSAGAWYARELEHESLQTFHAAQRQHPDQAIEVRPR